MTITNGTNPTILIDFNDGTSVIFLPNSLLNYLYSFNHTFTQDGSYGVNITVFNHVSTVSKVLRVGYN